MTINEILERRLQTVVFNKGLSRSIYQARQLISHGHVTISGQRVTSPSYIVLKGEEAMVAYTPTSRLANSDHPLRQSLQAEETTSASSPRIGKERTEEAE